jgi:hypothetical protein
MPLTQSGFDSREDDLARDSDWNVARLSPMILTAIVAIVLGGILVGLTDISTAAAIAVAVVFLLIGLLGVWMLDRRRQVA